MLEAVIFDFDGVITDSEILHLRSINEALSKYGASIAKDEYYKTYLGLTDLDVLKVLADKKLIDYTAIETIAEEKKKLFAKLAKVEGTIIPGVRDFLAMLKKNNVPMSICSGALLTEINMILDDSGLSSYFEVIVSSEQVKRGKPFPDGFLLTLNKINKTRPAPIQPNHCVVIEDSRWGIEAAKAAKMHTVAVTNSYDAAELAIAEKIIPHLDQLSMADLQNLCS
jgi:beta-phosphoglucomutase